MLKYSLAALSAAFAIAFAVTPGLASNHDAAGALPPSQWRPISIGSAPPSSKQEIVFGADGRVYGSDGCNRFSGRYVVIDGQLSIDTASMMATKMGCRDIMVQTATKAFMQALTDAHTFRVEGERLILLDRAGNELSQLARLQ